MLEIPIGLNLLCSLTSHSFFFKLELYGNPFFLNSVQGVVDYVILLGRVLVVPSIQEGPSVYVQMGSYEK